MLLYAIFLEVLVVLIFQVENYDILCLLAALTCTSFRSRTCVSWSSGWFRLHFLL
ncbi:hypothetical protein LguiB_034364 [Lonicera macranthoides]